LLPVHLYGQLADMRPLLDLARNPRLFVLEDACQAHGAARDGLFAGAAGDAAAFSFYPGKNLGAVGDAGAVTTNDETLAERTRALREHGQRAKYDHMVVGYTARLDSIQAAVLALKLPLLDEWNAQRGRIAAVYREELNGIGDLTLPAVAPDSHPAWHLFVVRSAVRDRLAEFLAARRITSGKHYPEPAHLSEAYVSLGYAEGSFPVAERLAREVLSLPMFPGMSSAQIEAVVEGVRACFANA